MSAPSSDASPANTAAPLTAAYEHAAVVGSAVVDAWDRRPFFNGGKGDEHDADEAKKAAAMGGAAGGGAGWTVRGVHFAVLAVARPQRRRVRASNLGHR